MRKSPDFRAFSCGLVYRALPVIAPFWHKPGTFLERGLVTPSSQSHQERTSYAGGGSCGFHFHGAAQRQEVKKEFRKWTREDISRRFCRRLQLHNTAKVT